MSLLAFHDVHALYGNARILNGVSFSVDAGERVALVGRNGVGKTTVVNTLCGMTRLAQGHVEVRGKQMTDLRGYTAAQNGIAIVLQGRGILPNLTVEENLLLGAATRRPGPWSLARVQELFPILAERRHNPGLALSGGQQQMLAIGRALMANPRVLLCDEISLGLAPPVIRDVYAALGEVRRRGTTVIIVEQDLGAALKASDRIYCFMEGRVCLSGKPSDLSRDAIRRAYFGG